MPEKIRNVEKELEATRERNSRVKADKAWETSGFRIFSIAVLAYIVAAFVLYFIGAEHFLLGALVPAIGYSLSTQSCPS